MHLAKKVIPALVAAVALLGVLAALAPSALLGQAEAKMTKHEDDNITAKSVVVCIGDSYADGGWPQTWTCYIGDLLGADVVKNYGMSGAGWLVRGNTFMMQMQQAATDYSFRNEEVTHVVIVGGINDSMSGEEAAGAAAELIDYADAMFPNAQITVVTHAWGDSPILDCDVEEIDGIRAACLDRDVVFVDYAWLWLKGIPKLVQDDHKHPNNAGGEYLGNIIASAVLGNYQPRSEDIGRLLGYGPDGQVRARFTLEGCTASMWWSGNVDRLSELVVPGWALPNKDIYGICKLGDGSECSVVVGEDGSVQLVGYPAGSSLGQTECYLCWRV